MTEADVTGEFNENYYEFINEVKEEQIGGIDGFLNSVKTLIDSQMAAVPRPVTKQASNESSVKAKSPTKGGKGGSADKKGKDKKGKGGKGAPEPEPVVSEPAAPTGWFIKLKILKTLRVFESILKTLVSCHLKKNSI